MKEISMKFPALKIWQFSCHKMVWFKFIDIIEYQKNNAHHILKDVV